MFHFHPILLLVLLASSFFPLCCNSIDTITPTQSIRDGKNETLVSPGETFALGFFTPGNSNNRYVGIWYNKISVQTVVWVANRENPVGNSSGVVLTIQGGNLVLVDDGGISSNTTAAAAATTLWSTNVSTAANSSTATLTDTGNLILSDDQGRVLWESFDHPTNTFLPRTKLGFDRRTGLNRVLTSWRSADDPAPGEFTHDLDLRGMPQFFLMKGGSDPIWRTGPWNGRRLSGVPVINRSSLYNTTYVATDDEIYFTYYVQDSSIITRFVLEDSGVYQRLMWSDKSGRWNVMWVAIQDRCDRYGNCGAYASCDPTGVAECTCFRGFEPKAPTDWAMRDWSQGCVRRKPLDCSGKEDGFWRIARVKLPDTVSARVEPNWSLKSCEEECLKNCSCTGYARANVSGEGSGCVIWYGELIDLRVYADQAEGQDFYARVAASELGGRGKKKLLVIILTVTAVILISFLICGYCWWRKTKGLKNRRNDSFSNGNAIEDQSGNGSELPLFSLDIIEAATNHFSHFNLLGQGGFGPVYKGQLLNGQEIAVKRLSQNSGQGIEEFKNEVLLIAKLQHRNLVRLLGCCISEEEKILIYEYMRNKSLDSLIFGQRRAVLDWRSRFNIIVGIARGILYLHEDSRLRIIHRDLKVSNILLDDDMNPKISDFGMARIFGGDQTHGNTNRVVGTFGYMAPEYAMDGLFSVKSDAFSFGVILLEIIIGKKNSYYSDGCSMNLIGHVWELWNEGKVLELVDSSISISTFESEVLRCIQVGLLCVQEKPVDRPIFSSIVFMLSHETTMPSPKQPAFSFGKGNWYDQLYSSTTGKVSSSTNELTITKVEAR